MNKLEFFINWFDREEERKTSLEGSLNIPIGILTVVFAIQFYLIKEFDFENTFAFEKYSLISFVAVSILSAFATTYYLFRSYHNLFSGFEYNGLPFPTQLLEYEKELIEYYELHKEYYGGIKGEDKFEEYLTNKLAKLVNANVFNNDIKSKYLHSSKRFIFISILTLVLGFIPFISNSITKPTKAQQIEIINQKPIDERLDKLQNQLNKFEEYVKRQKNFSDTSATATKATSGQGN